MDDSKVVKYRAERSGTVYYTLGVLVLIFGTGLSCHGCYSMVGSEPHPAFVKDPSCAEQLLLDKAEHLALPCAVFEAKISGVNKEGEFEFSPMAKVLRTGKTTLPDFYTGTIPDWTDSTHHQPVWLQIYGEGEKDFVVARVYDSVDKLVRLPKERPLTKGEGSGHEVKIGLMIAAFAIAWMLLGRFMKFSE